MQTEENAQEQEHSQDQSQDVSNDEFDSAFDEFAGDAPANEQPRDEQGRFAPQAQDDEEPQDNEAEDLPEAAEATGDDPDPASELERFKREAETWQHRYNSDLGRQNALQRKIQEQEQLIQQLQSKAPTAQGGNPEGSGMSDAEWNTLKEDFPEVAKAIEVQVNALSSRYEQEISQLKGQIGPIQQQAQEQFINQQVQALATQHPDYQDYMTPANVSPDQWTPTARDFRNWLLTQPPAVQQVAQSDNAADAAFLISSYKQHKAQTQQRADDVTRQRQRKLEQAKTIPSRSSHKRSVANDDFDAAFDEFAERAGR